MVSAFLDLVETRSRETPPLRAVVLRWSGQLRADPVPFLILVLPHGVNHGGRVDLVVRGLQVSGYELLVHVPTDSHVPRRAFVLVSGELGWGVQVAAALGRQLLGRQGLGGLPGLLDVGLDGDLRASLRRRRHEEVVGSSVVREGGVWLR